MRILKKLLASILIIAIALSDCGNLTALATENSVSENTISENDIPAEETSENSTEAETETNIELPALHIGQISNGEQLPTAKDDSFSYDLPLSFTSSENLILFVNYDIEMASTYKEAGTLEWSILRGEKGLAVGSASLLNEADDWNGFETVTASPYFTMEKITDTEDAYHQMMALLPLEPSLLSDDKKSDETDDSSAQYDYFIRAAYYTQTENGKAETFYAAATIPFVPQDHTAVETDFPAEDVPDTESAPTDSIEEPSSVSENDTENGADTISGNAVEANSSVSDNDIQDVSEDSDTEDVEAEQTAETLSSLSENNITATDESQEPQNPDNQEPPLLEETNGKIILYQGIVTDEANILAEKDRIPMAPGDTQQITAAIEPAMTQANILWESSDETVATVTADENGSAVITAKAEGYARITASCQGMTASTVVDVVRDCPTRESIPYSASKHRHYCICQQDFAEGTLM